MRLPAIFRRCPRCGGRRHRPRFVTVCRYASERVKTVDLATGKAVVEKIVCAVEARCTHRFHGRR